MVPANPGCLSSSVLCLAVQGVLQPPPHPTKLLLIYGPLQTPHRLGCPDSLPSTGPRSESGLTLLPVPSRAILLPPCQSLPLPTCTPRSELPGPGPSPVRSPRLWPWVPRASLGAQWPDVAGLCAATFPCRTKPCLWSWSACSSNSPRRSCPCSSSGCCSSTTPGGGCGSSSTTT